MLHPVKVRSCSSDTVGSNHISQASTSFECDGCNHHASYHFLENPAEQAVLARWTQEEQQAPTNNKRRKLLTSTTAGETTTRALIERGIEK